MLTTGGFIETEESEDPPHVTIDNLIKQKMSLMRPKQMEMTSLSGVRYPS